MSGLEFSLNRGNRLMQRKEREKYIKELETIRNSEYRLIGNYINNRTKTVVFLNPYSFYLLLDN